MRTKKYLSTAKCESQQIVQVAAAATNSNLIHATCVCRRDRWSHWCEWEANSAREAACDWAQQKTEKEKKATDHKALTAISHPTSAAERFASMLSSTFAKPSDFIILQQKKKKLS